MLPRRIQLLIWLVLYLLWLWISIDHHPTLTVDAVVTAILLTAYITAVYLNVLVLIPRVCDTRGFLVYCTSLSGLMLVLTFIALTALRFAYSVLVENGADLLGGFWENYLIDLVGMIVHVAGAAIVMRLYGRFKVPRSDF